MFNIEDGFLTTILHKLFHLRLRMDLIQFMEEQPSKEKNFQITHD
jgi:hypothetical protein